MHCELRLAELLEQLGSAVVQMIQRYWESRVGVDAPAKSAGFLVTLSSPVAAASASAACGWSQAALTVRAR